VFNLEVWEEIFVLEEPEGELSTVAWSADGNRLFLAAGFGTSGRTLWTVDVADQSSRRLADLDYWTDRIDVSPDGRTLYLFAFQLSDPQTFQVSGNPFLVVLDSSTGTEQARIDLPGMALGQKKEDGFDGETYAQYLPGHAISPNGQRYYIAHAEDDEITVVSLEEMKVERTVVPQRRHSIFEKAIGTLLGVGRAEAKGGPSNRKQLVVSPDGERVFVTGGRDHEVAEDSPGYEPVGLTVLEADTLEIVAEHEGVGGIQLSPDGSLLFATGWSHQWTRTGPNELTPDRYRGSGLKVIDADTGALVSEFEPERIFESVVPATSGKVVYLITHQPGYRGLAWKQTGCAVLCQTITVYDVSSGSAIAERVLNTHIVELFSAAFAPQ
jgi:DNA-binding beta-propeller fold protein YncE